MNIPQKLLFSTWLLTFSTFLYIIYDILTDQGATADHQVGGYIFGLLFITFIFWVLFRVWGDKKT